MRQRREFGIIRTRKHKSGTIYLEASYAPPADAVKKYPNIHIPRHVTKNFPTSMRPAAEAWLYQAQRLIALNAWEPPQLKENEQKANRVTFRQYATEWLQDHRKPDGSEIAEGTKEKYREYLKNHLLPAFGTHPVREISEKNVREWFTSFPTSNGHGETMRRHCYTLLKSIMASAATDTLTDGTTLIERNPCTIKVSKVHAKHQQVIATQEELRRAAKAMPPHLSLAVLLAGTLGLRRGEILGLQRQDIDLESRLIHVRRSAKYSRDAHGTWRMSLGATKTANSVRDVMLPSSMLGDVKKQLEEAGESPESLLFHRNDGSLVGFSYLEDVWRIARATVPKLKTMHFHDLRHTALTHLAEHGATVAELEDIAGHADARTAMHYQHAVDAHERTVIEETASAGTESGDRVERVASVLSSMSESERAKLIRLLARNSG